MKVVWAMEVVKAQGGISNDSRGMQDGGERRLISPSPSQSSSTSQCLFTAFLVCFSGREANDDSERAGVVCSGGDAGGVPLERGGDSTWAQAVEVAAK